MTAELKLGSPEAKEVLARAQKIIERLTLAEGRAQEIQLAAEGAFNAVQTEQIEEQLATLDIEQIKTVTEGRLRLDLIRYEGYRTIRDLSGVPAWRLQGIDRVGPVTANKVKEAVDQLTQTVREHTEVRIDAKNRPASHEALLEIVWRQEHIDQILSKEQKPFSILSELRELHSEVAPVLRPELMEIKLWRRGVRW
jgi:hypothetical protein